MAPAVIALFTTTCPPAFTTSTWAFSAASILIALSPAATIEEALSTSAKPTPPSGLGRELGGIVGGAAGGSKGGLAGGYIGGKIGSRAGDAWERRANRGAHDKWNNKGRKDRGYGGGWRFSDEID